MTVSWKAQVEALQEKRRRGERLSEGERAALEREDYLEQGRQEERERFRERGERLRLKLDRERLEHEDWMRELDEMMESHEFRESARRPVTVRIPRLVREKIGQELRDGFDLSSRRYELGGWLVGSLRDDVATISATVLEDGSGFEKFTHSRVNLDRFLDQATGGVRGCGAWHSHPSGDVRNEWGYTVPALGSPSPGDMRSALRFLIEDGLPFEITLIATEAKTDMYSGWSTPVLNCWITKRDDYGRSWTEPGELDLL